ncbi:alpha/beta hydrolase [Dyadobacter frigoris]|uniref:Alpha/beta hydrolase n=1 Tax=Dyadobacter frigoris TaxID=2576211 RepID=A0A4U6D3G4_9BACT|nr:alpha/beta hydrolase [Dyadobacter frigoris]TKT90428.1 alpha/beta hydrolase [Dyadobacter frigoris]GLU51450.1 alpha/beta hydrolase [Dyadobacter frigoris]
MKVLPSKTILFITGAFVSNVCWDEWKTYFENKGYRTLAPAWPNKNATAEDLRNRHPDTLVASMRLSELIEYYAEIASDLPEKPILIGHSIGGLICQILLQRDLATAAVAIHSVPPQGIITFQLSFLIAGWGPLGFFTPVNKSFLMSFRQWRYAFTNGLSMEIQKEGYYKLAIPESKMVVRDTITKIAKIDFEKPHAPLLLISGTADHTIPASLNYANYTRYKSSGSVTDYKKFEGRTHFVLGQDGWQEVADYALKWLQKQN